MDTPAIRTDDLHAYLPQWRRVRDARKRFEDHIKALDLGQPD